MIAFTRNACEAFVLVIASVLSFPAGAVSLDGEGLGQALIYPYFTTQATPSGPFNTYISVVNRTSDSKVLRVRFREGRNSREIGAFNLYLAAWDTWTAAVVPNGAGARVLTSDQSCVNGAFIADDASGVSRHLDLGSASYTGNANDNLGTGLDRTREGFVEMIEMATLTGASATNVSLPQDNPSATAPVNCAAVQGTSVVLQIAPPSGGLSGSLTLINVANGADFTTNAVALASLSSLPFYRDVGDAYPDFNAGEVTPVSHFVAGGKTYRATWGSGVEAVASVMTARTLGNETILETVTNSSTDWIVTFPLRRFQLPPVTSGAAAYPPAPNAGLAFSLQWWPRDGRGLALVDECGFQCPGNTYPVRPRLPWASTVISFALGADASSAASSASLVLGSSNAIRLTLPTAASNGAGQFDFGPNFGIRFQGSSIRLSDGAIGNESGAILGASAVGFMVRILENGQLNCGSILCQGSYGGAFPHSIGRSIGP